MPTHHCSQPAFFERAATHDYEGRMNKVVLLTLFMMVAEIAGGWLWGSMALLADGFHMATHVLALGISAFAYGYARRHAQDARYSFGTGKVTDLAGFTSAIILIFITLYVFYESTLRLVAPVAIAYHEATVIAFIGLLVNVFSALILQGAKGHDHHGHDHAHGHEHSHHKHHDNNFRSAYIHVIADALTSVAALLALVCGSSLGWGWMDPVMGLVGGGVILSWAWGLLRDTSMVLLDRDPGGKTAQHIRDHLAAHSVQITDLHVWRVGHNCHAAVLAVMVPSGISADQVRSWLAPLGLAHVTIEIIPTVVTA